MCNCFIQSLPVPLGFKHTFNSLNSCPTLYQYFKVLPQYLTQETRRRQTKQNKTKHNTGNTGQRQTNKKHNKEILSTLGTPDTGQRQTNKNTTQRYCQHWVHQPQDRDKQTKTQYRDTVNIGFVCLSLFCVWCSQC
jgi:hypothetical protein